MIDATIISISSRVWSYTDEEMFPLIFFKVASYPKDDFFILYNLFPFILIHMHWKYELSHNAGINSSTQGVPERYDPSG